MSKNIHWIEYSGTTSEWDNLVLINGGNYRQLYLWGERQKKLGWNVYRYIHKLESSSFVVQILSKKKFFFQVFYIPGGVVDNKYGYGHLNALLKKIAKKKIFYVKLDSSYLFDPGGSEVFKINNWKRPLYFINSAETIFIDLSNNRDFLSSASRRWRRQLRKSQDSNKIFITKETTSSDLEHASSEMQKFKNIYLRDDPSNIIEVINTFNDQVITVCAYHKGEMLGFRAALIHGRKAWDFYAATTPMGRKMDVGYLLIYELLKETQKQDVHSYTLPLSRTNIGDTQFKKRLNGSLNLLMGEWEYSNSTVFRLLINVMIYLSLNSRILVFIKKNFN